MSKIYKLAEMIVKDDKMSNEEIIETLAESIGKDEKEVYRKLYEDAYGKTLTLPLAEDKVKAMSVSDNSDRPNGQKWSYEQTVEAGSKIGINWQEVPKAEWYFVMNMMYSDYYCTAKYAEKQLDPTFFAHLAKDWIYDDDAPEEKTYLYVMNVLC